jgi:hypothetical protein
MMIELKGDSTLSYRDRTLAQLHDLCSRSEAQSLMTGACFGVMAMHSAWMHPVWHQEIHDLWTSVSRAIEERAIHLQLTHDVQLSVAATARVRVEIEGVHLTLDRLASQRPLDAPTLRCLFTAGRRRRAAGFGWIDFKTQSPRVIRRSLASGVDRTKPIDDFHELIDLSNVRELCADDRFSPVECLNKLRRWSEFGDLVRLLARGNRGRTSTPESGRHYETVASVSRRHSLGQANLVRDASGMAVGALCWSLISKRTEVRLLSQAARPTSVYEINDGRTFLLEAAALDASVDLARLRKLIPLRLSEVSTALVRDGETLRPFRWTDDKDFACALSAVQNTPATQLS